MMYVVVIIAMMIVTRIVVMIATMMVVGIGATFDIGQKGGLVSYSALQPRLIEPSAVWHYTWI
jgi:hypothetical protein